MKIYKRCLSLILVLILTVCFNLNVFGCEKDDEYGGHFEKSPNGFCTKYKYCKGEYAGWEVTFKIPVIWGCRYTKLKRPFGIKDNSIGTWCDTGCHKSYSPTCVKTSSIEPSCTSHSCTLPAKVTGTKKPCSETPHRRTPLVSASHSKTSPTISITPKNTMQIINTSTTNDPNATNIINKTPTTLPQTGENNNIIPLVISLILIGSGIILLIKNRHLV